jgi:predicted alpha/beta superfamily hydrolase
MRLGKSLSLVLITLLLAGCVDTQKESVVKSPEEKPAEVAPERAAATAKGGQRGNGQPYEVAGSEVWDVPDPVSGRNYQIFVALPPSYADSPERHYPVLYVTDADYGFPLIRQIGRRLNGNGPAIDDFILVGLSYARGDDGMTSRRRDYTPTPKGSDGAPADAVHGMGGAYVAYLRDQALPFVAQRYRTDESRRLFLGHSYGALLGTQILLTEPELFSGYILGSPSYWYDGHYMDGVESAFAATHKDLPARIYMYVGQYEDMKPGDPRYATSENMVSDARKMERALRSRNYPSLQLKLDVLNDEDHLSVAPRGFIHGLKYLLGTDAH